MRCDRIFEDVAPSFHYAIALTQLEYRSDRYTKTLDGKWLLTEHESDEAVLELSSIQFQINLSDIYEKVNFAEGEE